MRGENIYEDTFLKTYAAMELVRSHIVSVSGHQDLLLFAYCKLELAACNIGCLAVIMLVEVTYGAFLEMHLDNHKLTVVTHNLALNAFSGRLPLELPANLESFTSCLHIS